MKQSENSVQLLIEQIMQAANLKGLPEAEEKVFKDNMEFQINRRLGLIIVGNLDESGREKYEKMLEAGDEPTAKSMQELMEAHIPNYEEAIRGEMDEFVKELITAMSK